MTPTRYRIVASDPNAHLFEVCCTVADPDRARRGPNRYLLADPGRNGRTGGGGPPDSVAGCVSSLD
jgi:hypothetical protein